MNGAGATDGWEEPDGQREMGCKMRREGRGGLEEEATVREAVPRHGTAVRRVGANFRVER